MHTRAAATEDSGTVGRLVRDLLVELADDGQVSGGPEEFAATASEVLAMDERAWAFLAFDGENPVGVITLNECVSIYAGGIFGEICELYIHPDYRSRGVAVMLLDEARNHGCRRGWGRLEVGAPPWPDWQRTFDFYVKNGFVEVGPRLKLRL
ncbi:MAG: GNAT family N-acetyltransferase [Pseudomonadota bacterium]